jgi:hypothetical protein
MKNIKVIKLIIVFDEIDEDMMEEKLKLKYLDCFLTRYVFHTFTRWCDRLQLAIGLKK